MADLYRVTSPSGEIEFEGTINQIANILKVTRPEIYDAKNTGKWIKDHKITQIYREVQRSDIDEHLFNENGTRKYEYKYGFPNRYKGSSGVRFSPM